MNTVKCEVELGKTIKGFLPVTMLDWEGKISTGIYFGGCNFRCSFCHNPDLVLKDSALPSISWTGIKTFLINRKGWIDGVVVGGGEPTISPEISEILLEIKELGLLVKIDTNGSNPHTLRSLLENELVDYIAMDVKSSFDRYNEATKSIVDTKMIRESIDLIIASGVDNEFRTTVYPGAVDNHAVEEIAGYLSSRGVSKYVLQQFKPTSVLSNEAAEYSPYTLDYLKEMALVCNNHLPTKTR